MAKAYSVLEINGNRYDAVTGQIMNTAKKVASRTRKAPVGVIDGFTRRASRPTIIAPTQPKPAKPLSSASNRPSAVKRHKQPAHAIHKRTQRSRALMRAVVKKPSSSEKNSDEQHVLPAKQLAPIDSQRVSRAKTIVKNVNIKRFGSAAQPAPRSPLRGVPSATSKVQPKPAASSVRAVPAVMGRMSSQQLERLLDQALMKADAHKNSGKNRLKKTGIWQRTKSRPSWRTIGATTAIVLILGGFFAWQNIPQFSMKMAASRANIPASVPGYTPSGFSFAGPISYSNGAVSISFKANSDNVRSFTLVQQKSTLDSQTLGANTVPANSQVQTSQINGKTVYIYGSDNHATWVDSGVKYTLTDKANLTSDQILKIVGSL